LIDSGADIYQDVNLNIISLFLFSQLIVFLFNLFKKTYTVLHAACKGGHLEIAKYLIEQGQVDINAVDQVSGLIV